MVDRSIRRIRDWLQKEPMRLEQTRTWFPFWVGLFAILLGYAFESGGLLFPEEDSTWAAMQKSGSWRIGVDPSFPPFEFLDDNDQPIGFDIALANQLAEGWGLQVEIVPIGYDSLIDAVQSGQIDSIVSALPYDPRLTKDIRFSDPYFDAGTLVAVPEDSPLHTSATAFKTAADAPYFLSGKRVGVEWGGMGDMLGRRYQRVDANSEIELVPFSTQQEAVNALHTSPFVDAALIDNVTYQQMRRARAIIQVGPILDSNPYVIASPLNATVLIDAIDQSLAKLQNSGELEMLTHKWFRE